MTGFFGYSSRVGGAPVRVSEREREQVVFGATGSGSFRDSPIGRSRAVDRGDQLEPRLEVARLLIADRQAPLDRVAADGERQADRHEIVVAHRRLLRLGASTSTAALSVRVLPAASVAATAIRHFIEPSLRSRRSRARERRRRALLFLPGAALKRARTVPIGLSFFDLPLRTRSVRAAVPEHGSVSAAAHVTGTETIPALEARRRLALKSMPGAVTSRGGAGSPGGIGAATTSTGTNAEDASPAESLTAAAAVCRPGVANVCVTVAPVARAPSLKVHSGSLTASPRSASLAVAVNVIGSPTRTVVWSALTVTTGARRPYSNAPMSRRAVPSPSPSATRALPSMSRVGSPAPSGPGRPASIPSESCRNRSSSPASANVGSPAMLPAPPRVPVPELWSWLGSQSEWLRSAAAIPPDVSAERPWPNRVTTELSSWITLLPDDANDAAHTPIESGRPVP